MRHLKPILLLTVLCLLFSMYSVGMAEDEIVSAPVDIEVGETESIGVNGLFAEDEAITEPETADPESEAFTVMASANGDFEIDENGCLTKYKGLDTNIVIPDGVTEIGSSVFSNMKEIESVTLPDNVTSIGSSAFSGCINLKSIKLSSNLKTIGYWAFSNCKNLNDVKLPSKLESIEWSAFAGCSGLTSIVIPDGVSLDTSVFSGCSSLASVKFPKSMTTLPKSTFSDCDSLKDISFLKGITEIGESAFTNCDGLVSIALPDTITDIDSHAFSSCDNLESVTIPASITYMDRNAFEYCENVVIRGTPGTYAEKYTSVVGIPFNAPVVKCDEKGDFEEYIDNVGFVDYFFVYINQTRSIKVKQSPADLATSLEWSSSNNEIVTVDQDGNVKGIAPGEATITASTADGKGKAAQLHIFIPDSTEVSFEEYENTVPLDSVLHCYILLNTPYSSDTGVKMPVSITSSDSSILSIDAVNGSNNEYEVTLLSHKLGKATITATTTDNGKASLDIEVIRPDANSIEIEQSNYLTLKVGMSTTLTYAIMPKEADTTKIYWLSDDPSIISINNKGVITALKEGQTTINIVNDNCVYDYITVYVEPDNPTKVTLNKTKATLGAKDTVTLKAKLTPADTKTKLTWKSNKPKVAKVSPKGVVTALTKGTAIITVTAENGKKATAKITVKPGPKTITLYKSGKKVKAGATLELKKGKSLTLKAKLPSGTLSTLTWSSDKPKVAKVSKTGKITALKAGTATITVKAANGTKVKVKIRVK